MTTENESGGDRRKAGEMPLPGGDFRMFISKLGFQALIALGIIENPLTKKSERNLDHAKMVIDDLLMLRNYTKNNLNRDEETHLTKIVSDLQFHFVKAVEQSGGSAGEA